MYLNYVNRSFDTLHEPVVEYDSQILILDHYKVQIPRTSSDSFLFNINSPDSSHCPNTSLDTVFL